MLKSIINYKSIKLNKKTKRTNTTANNHKKNKKNKKNEIQQKITNNRKVNRSNF